MPTRLTLIPLLASLLVAPLEAQQPDSGTVEITVRESMGMLDGFLVRSETRRATTDAAGRARLVLPAGRRTLLVTRIGFTPKRAEVTVVADSTISAIIDVAMEDKMEMEKIIISATRTERLAGETPVRVEVLDEMEVDENTLMAPSGITMLLNETPGLRVQPASPTLGTGSVRILGLSGQYTAMLADGLPLYGGAASALGPLDISPVDLKRVELIKGAASALYGGQALGGVINLISKPPTGRSEFLLNRRTMGVTDAATWLSRRLSEQSGVSLLASGTVQNAADPDGDGWGDQPRARRWGIRPRFSSSDSSGRSLFVTAGYGYDDRRGGTLGNPSTPAGTFREQLRGRRHDAGMTLRVPRADSGNIAARVALSTNRRERLFGPGGIERDRISTGFAELTLMSKSDRGAAVFGAAMQADRYHNELNSAFDHKWLTQGLFVTADRDVGGITVSGSVRGDFHSELGLMVTERLAVLARPADGWSVRLSGGTGFAAPASMTEEVEAIGLRNILPAELRPERSLGAMIDVNGRALGAEVLLTGYGSSIGEAIRLMEPTPASGTAVLRNSAGPTRVSGAEAAAIWRFAENKFLLTYGYARGSRANAESGQREPVPLLNRHRAGADLMLEKPGVYRVGIEGIYYGRQVLDDNPYRSESKPYVYAMAIAMRQFGPVELVANFENLLNVRQTDYDPLIRPSQTVGGRWTTDVWAPLEGFMANVAMRVRVP